MRCDAMRRDGMGCNVPAMITQRNNEAAFVGGERWRRRGLFVVRAAESAGEEVERAKGGTR